MKKAPLELVKLQEWLPQILGLDKDEYLLQKAKIECERPAYFNSMPYDSIALYHERSWNKGLEFLIEAAPFTHLFLGSEKFKVLGLAFLKKCRFFHETLETLPSRFSEWVGKEWNAQEGLGIFCFLQADLAMHEARSAERKNPIDLSYIGDYFSQPMVLQPHARLIKIGCDLSHFYQKFYIGNEQSYEGVPNSQLKRGGVYRYILFRNRYDVVSWEELDEKQFLFFEYLDQGICFNEANQLLGKNLSIENFASTVEWFYIGMERGWITNKKEKFYDLKRI